MLMKSVISSNIDKVGYDDKSKVLYIQFIGGGIYQYDKVSSQLHNNLIKSDSVGRYFACTIKGGFKYKKITEDELNKVIVQTNKPTKKKKEKIVKHPKNVRKKKVTKKKKKTVKYGGKGI